MMKLENMAEMLVLRRLDIRRALAMTDGSRLNVRLDVSEWASGAYLVEGVDVCGMSRKGKFVK